jgi:hypothetical protein
MTSKTAEQHFPQKLADFNNKITSLTKAIPHLIIRATGRRMSQIIQPKCKFYLIAKVILWHSIDEYYIPKHLL